MKQQPAAFILLGALALSIFAAGCASSPAPEIKGRWQAVNRYAATTDEIPLYPTYMFYPMPMDGTLRSMLARWAKDTGMTLSYLNPSDFTLHAPVAQIHTRNLREAVSQLNAIYAGQRISIVVQGNQIVARPADAPVTETTSGGSAAQSNAP